MTLPRSYRKNKPNYFSLLRGFNGYFASSLIRRPVFKSKASKRELKMFGRWWDVERADVDPIMITYGTFVKNTGFVNNFMRRYSSQHKFFKKGHVYFFEFEGKKYYFSILYRSSKSWNKLVKKARRGDSK